MRTGWETTVVALFAVFPFLPLFPHTATLTTICACVTLVAWLCGNRKRGIAKRLRGADRAAAVFAALYLLRGGRTGIASAVLICCAWCTVRSLNDRWRRRVLERFVCSASVCACVGIVEYFSGNASLRWVDLNRFSDIGGRVCATFDNPNVLAIYLLCAYPFALFGLISGMTARRRFRYGVYTISIAFCCVLTWSRGAWLGILAETFSVLWRSGRRDTLVRLLSVVILCIPFLPHSVRNRLCSITDLHESSVRYRLAVWRGVWRMIAANPFGIGAEEANFHTVWQRFAPIGTETVMHAHAILPQIALEIGVHGAIVFVVLLVMVLRSSQRSGRTAARGALLGLFVMGLFDHLWYARGMLWLITAVVALILPVHNGIVGAKRPIRSR